MESFLIVTIPCFLLLGISSFIYSEIIRPSQMLDLEMEIDRLIESAEAAAAEHGLPKDSADFKTLMRMLQITRGLLWKYNLWLSAVITFKIKIGRLKADGSGCLGETAPDYLYEIQKKALVCMMNAAFRNSPTLVITFRTVRKVANIFGGACANFGFSWMKKSSVLSSAGVVAERYAGKHADARRHRPIPATA